MLPDDGSSAKLGSMMQSERCRGRGLGEVLKIGEVLGLSVYIIFLQSKHIGPISLTAFCHAKHQVSCLVPITQAPSYEHGFGSNQIS